MTEQQPHTFRTKTRKRRNALATTQHEFRHRHTDDPQLHSVIDLTEDEETGTEINNEPMNSSSIIHSASLSYDANHQNIIRVNTSPEESTSISHPLISPSDQTLLWVRNPLISPTNQMLLRPVSNAIHIPTHSAFLAYDAYQIDPLYRHGMPRAPITIIKVERDHNTNPIGVNLTWDMSRKKSAENILAYQLFVDVETELEGHGPEIWNYIGTMKAFPLPMSCNINRLTIGKRYHFILRAIDIFNRFGASSIPKSITYI